MRTYQSYQNDYDFAVRLPDGRVIYYVEHEEAIHAETAIARGRPPHPPKAKRLAPFGEGIEQVGDRYEVTFLDTSLGLFKDLPKALKAWDEAEQYARFQISQDVEIADIDSRYYHDLRFDEDGYKIFTPKPP